MTPLKIGIVEDDFIIAESIFVALQQLGYAPIRPVPGYDAALKMIEAESPDFLIIDIIISGTPDGIDLAGMVNKEFRIPFIFLTGNSDEATINRAKPVKPRAYLVKPFTESDLFSAIEIAFANHNAEVKLPQQAAVKTLENFIFIKERDVFVKIELNDILFVESDNVYLNINTPAKVYVVRNKLENFLNCYAHHNFMRVHRSYVINVNHLQSLNNISVVVGGHEIPINKTYKRELMAMVNSLK